MENHLRKTTGSRVHLPKEFADFMESVIHLFIYSTLIYTDLNIQIEDKLTIKTNKKKKMKKITRSE